MLISLLSLVSVGQTISQLGYYTKNGVHQLTAKGNYMILSGGEIIDNSIPSSPTLFSQCSFSGDGMSVIVNNDYAYFGTGMGNELFIVDISNISFPLQQSSIPFEIGHGVFGMDISGNTLFVALGGEGVFCSIDVSDKSNPVMLDTIYASSGQCRDVVLKNNYAYTANYDGMKVIDISNPSAMQLLTSIGSGYTSIDIDLENNLVFLGKNSGGADVFDISSPQNPVPAFQILNSSGTAWDIKYNDNHVYLATNSNGLYIYEIEDNTSVEKVNFPNTDNGQSFGVCVQDSLVLLSGLINGVAVLQYDATGTVGFHSELFDENIYVFPNPSTGLVNINLGDLKNSKLKVFNVLGELVYEEDNIISSTYQFNLDEELGIYFIEVFSGDKKYKYKLILRE